MDIKIFKTLPDDAVDIRLEVFVDEQGFQEEFDSDDNTATHFVGFIDGKAVATCRIIQRDEFSCMIGRIAVRKNFRKGGLGGEIVHAAETRIKELGFKKIYIHSQLQAVPFYEKIGYSQIGETDFEEGCPHCMMFKNL